MTVMTDIVARQVGQAALLRSGHGESM